MTTTLLDGDAVRVAGADFDHLVTAARDAVDGLPVAAVGATGARGIEPLLAATVAGRTAYYPQPTPARAAEIASTAAAADLDPGFRTAVDHDPGTPHLPVPAGPPLGAGTRDVLAACGWLRPTSIEDYEAAGGFTATDVDADTALPRIADLRGRGWADSTHDTDVHDVWSRVRSATDTALVVSVQDDPADRLLCTSTPLAVLDAALTAARLVDATDVVVAASQNGDGVPSTLRDAAAAIPSDVTGDRTIRVEAVPDDHVAAEPTMTIEALEGSDRLEARRRPPGPADHGLHGRPTLVHTPRTLVQAARSIATDRDPTRIRTVTGDVDAPTTVELPHDSRLRDALDAATPTDGVKAVVVGGRFGGLTADRDVPLTPDALADAGLGTDGTIEVIGQGRCVVAAVGRRTAEAADGNCGRCVPCREGTTQLRGQLRAVYDGDLDRDGIAELSRVMAATSLCAYGRHAQRPVRTALDAFADEFAAHANGECPAGRCDMALDVEVLP